MKRREFKDFPMPQIAVHGHDVHYRDEGSSVPLLLGHCSTGSSGQWRELFKLMAGRHRLVAPDHIGYGRTAAYSGGIPLMELEIAIIETLMRSIGEPVHLVGHSYGGSLLARAAVRRPEQARSLTLVEPTLFYLLAPFGRAPEHAELTAVADRFIRYVEAGDADEAARGFIEYWVRPGAYDAMDEKLREAVRAGMTKLAVEWGAAFEPYGATPEALSALNMPIHLIGASRTTPSARAVMDVLRGLWPKAAYAEIGGAGHMSPVTHANAVNEIIDTFVSKV